MKKAALKKFRENYSIWDETTPVPCDGLELAVHFDEKDNVKQLGGRWDPDKKTWWMPVDRLSNDCPIGCELMGDGWGGTILDWLNNHMMVKGFYGEVDSDRAMNIIGDDSGTVYHLRNMDGETVEFTHYAAGLVGVKSVNGSSIKNNIQLAADARSVWDALTAGGYVRA